MLVTEFCTQNINSLDENLFEFIINVTESACNLLDQWIHPSSSIKTQKTYLFSLTVFKSVEMARAEIARLGSLMRYSKSALQDTSIPGWLALNYTLLCDQKNTYNIECSQTSKASGGLGGGNSNLKYIHRRANIFFTGIREHADGTGSFKGDQLVEWDC